MRWFAWCNLFFYHIGEVIPFLMILESLFGSVDCQPGMNNMDQLREDFSGFKLAYQILKQPMLITLCKGLYIALQCSWTWYTDEVTSPSNQISGGIPNFMKINFAFLGEEPCRTLWFLLGLRGALTFD